MAQDDVNEAEKESGEDGEEGEEGEAKGGINKKLLLILIPVLLLAIGGGLYFTGIIGGGGDETHVEESAEDGHEEVKLDEHGEPIVEGAINEAFFALPDMIVNLSARGGESRFLKLKVQLEIENEADLPAIEAITPRVIDQFQTYLREMRVEDLRGSAGIYRLRQELLYRVNIASHPIKVTDILFQEMLIQ